MSVGGKGKVGGEGGGLRPGAQVEVGRLEVRIGRLGRRIPVPETRGRGYRCRTLIRELYGVGRLGVPWASGRRAGVRGCGVLGSLEA